MIWSETEEWRDGWNQLAFYDNSIGNSVIVLAVLHPIDSEVEPFAFVLSEIVTSYTCSICDYFISSAFLLKS